MTHARFWIGAAAVLCGAAAALPAAAGDNNGDFMVRVLATGVLPDTDADAIAVGANPAAFPADNYEVSDQLIPALTLSYFFNKNVALELFCCFAEHNIDGKGVLGTVAPDVGDTWIFPPALTLQYHLDPIGGFKPYAGVGVQYIAFFDTQSNDLGGSMDIDNAWGFTLQAGVDVELGSGWYLNADLKKTWLDTSWTITGSPVTAGAPISGSFDLDPWIVSAGIGYRFNLADIFGSREAVPLK